MVWSAAAAVHRGHRLLEEAAANELPSLLVLRKQRDDWQDGRAVIGEDAVDPGAAVDLLVQSIQRVVTTNGLRPTTHQDRGSGKHLRKYADHLPPVRLHRRCLRLHAGRSHPPAWCRCATVDRTLVQPLLAAFV
jgi:hypothetical protein